METNAMTNQQFPVTARWRGGKLSFAAAHGDVLRVAAPPASGGAGDYWSPEELMVAAAATCLALTIAAITNHRHIPLVDATITATGQMGWDAEGRLGIARIDMDALLDTLPGNEKAIEEAAGDAEERCIVARALALPVSIGIRVRVADAVATAAS